MSMFSVAPRSAVKLASLLLLKKIGTLLAAACLLVLPSAVRAQTAHFSGAITTLSSTFSDPAGVAVDSFGNVFVADYGNNAVKEIVAVGGERRRLL